MYWTDSIFIILYSPSLSSMEECIKSSEYKSCSISRFASGCCYVDLLLFELPPSRWWGIAEAFWSTLPGSKQDYLLSSTIPQWLCMLCYSLVNSCLLCVQAVVEMGDSDDDGLLNFREFMKYCAEHEKKLWLVFQNLDKNQDGECNLTYWQMMQSGMSIDWCQWWSQDHMMSLLLVQTPHHDDIMMTSSTLVGLHACAYKTKLPPNSWKWKCNVWRAMIIQLCWFWSHLKHCTCLRSCGFPLLAQPHLGARLRS